MKVILETSLDPLPCGAEPWQITCSPTNKVEYLKKKVFFEVRHGLCTASLLEDYRLQKKDGTTMRDAETLMYYEITDTDTVYMRERRARRIHVHWQLQRHEIWVRSGSPVKNIFNRVCMKLASQLGAGAGNPDKFELLRASHGSEVEEGSNIFLQLAPADSSPLPWNSTLEQLGFGETPELRLKERIRSRVASRSSSIGASTQITIRVETPPPLTFSSSDILQADPPVVPSEVAVKTDDVTAASFHLDWSELSLDNTNDPITAYILEYGESCSSAPPRTISLSGEVEEHTVTALKPHTEYYVKVAAVNAAGRGPFCEPVLLQTAPDKPVAAPENVQVQVPEDKPSIFVTWSPIQKQYYNSDSLTGYHVRYTTSSKDSRGGTVLVPSYSTKCTINFLDRGVAYAVSVAAGNCIGIGPYSIPSVTIVGEELGNQVPTSSTETLDVYVQTENFRDTSLPHSNSFTQTNHVLSSDGGLSPVPATIQPRHSKGNYNETDSTHYEPTPTDPDEKLLHLLTPLLDNLPLELPPPDVSIQDLSQRYSLIYIVILDLTVKPYLVDVSQCIGHTIKELCDLLRLPNPSEWYLTRSHGLQVLMSGANKSQQAVGLSRRKTSKGKKPCFSVGTALTSLDVDSILDVTQLWRDIDFKSQPHIVHLRPWEVRVVERLLEGVDFGGVDEAELGQQVYQPWYRITQGHHPVDKATAAEVAALMCQAKFRDGSPSQNDLKDAVSSCLPDKHRRKKSVKDIAIRKYSDLLLKETSPEVATQLLVGCVSGLPVNNGIFFKIKVPSRGSLVPKMKEGVLGIGPKEIVHLDGETAEVLLKKTYKQINCFHASNDAIIIDFGAHDVEAFEASTSRAFDILHIVKMYIQQQPILEERPSVIPHYDPGSMESIRSQIQLHDSFPMLQDSYLWEQAKSKPLHKD